MTDIFNLPEPDLCDGVWLNRDGEPIMSSHGYRPHTVRRLIDEAVRAEREECMRLCVQQMHHGRRELRTDYIEAASNCARDIDNRNAT